MCLLTCFFQISKLRSQMSIWVSFTTSIDHANVEFALLQLRCDCLSLEAQRAEQEVSLLLKFGQQLLHIIHCSTFSQVGQSVINWFQLVGLCYVWNF